MTFAFNYGGRAELVDATRAIAEAVASGRLRPDKIDESVLNRHLYAPDMPDPDLLVRTSGEFRISNYLLWELAYSELVFTDVLWPDFRREHLAEAIAEYQKRDRRFGVGLKTAPQRRCLLGRGSWTLDCSRQFAVLPSRSLRSRLRYDCLGCVCEPVPR